MKTPQEALDSLEEISFIRHPNSFQTFVPGGAGGVTATIAAIAGKSHYLTDLVAWSDTATRVEIWQGSLKTRRVLGETYISTYARQVAISFKTPLKADENQALNVEVIDATADCGVTILGYSA